jgi:HD-GYP domain-containing protein (c-di-GMP phosphodiesterase class II)
VALATEISARSVRAKNVRAGASQVLSQVLLCNKMAGLYAGDNENVRRSYETLAQKLDDFFKFEPTFRLHLEEGYLFVNEVRCRVERASAEAHYWFLERYSDSGIATITIDPGVNVVELRKLVPLFATAVWRDGEAPPRIGEKLRESFVVNVKVAMRRLREIRTDDAAQVEISSQKLAAAFWLRLYAAATEAIEVARRGGVLSLRKARSLLQLVIDAFIEDEAPLHAVTRVRNYAPADADPKARWARYLPGHLANTAILSIGLGNRLGLDRRQLLDLGTAALFADVAMITIPEAILTRPGPLSDDLRGEVDKHALRGAEMILAADGGVRANHIVAAAAARHHDGDSGEDGHPSLLPAIIAVADAYDAMTSDRPWRRALSHARALRELVDGESGHVPLLAKVFGNFMGLFPVGTAVELTGGEVAIVVEQNPAPRMVARPKIKLLIEMGGKPSSGRIVDLTERDAQGEFARSIRRSLDMGLSEGGPAEIVALL